MEGKTMGKRFLGNDRGQTAIEYLGIIAVVVAIVLVLTRTDFGSAIASAISDKITEVTSG
ncbi:Flp family type IVb pilin [Streptomyces albireticuli]|uniref:Flp family type IVb pilin n=3 Tax=Streptomyces TaxID=1883 RepID=A0A1Z2L1I9_9ACTN|nr:membrane protein [Streptomyces albireticuli]MBB5117277.1 pilus assembly protein Flp/PilA [Streptomyces eurocidicus]PAU47780.1 Flp family type IVb pilin [Streptomyces albireticuli]